MVDVERISSFENFEKKGEIRVLVSLLTVLHIEIKKILNSIKIREKGFSKEITKFYLKTQDLCKRQIRIE